MPSTGYTAYPMSKQIVAAYKKTGARVGTRSKVKLRSKSDIALYYTPGVGAAAQHLATHPNDARSMSIKGNSVAVISDGSAVLGLGNIGPYGALPVMEGKAHLFQELAGIDAWPLVLNTQDPQEIIQTIRAIAPNFSGINLEDIKAPQCFEIEKVLSETLDIPVMHDDQHGTAIVVLAALMNASNVVRRPLKKLRIVISGAGAAGSAVAHLLGVAGIADIVVLDRTGVLHKERKDLRGPGAKKSPYKVLLAANTNPRGVVGGIADALADADVFIGLSGGGNLDPSLIRTMAPKPIIFALANPTPEIFPDVAHAAGSALVATGRSDFPNQVNNALVFPGVFRGLLDYQKTAITDAMKVKAATALSSLIQKPTTTRILPEILDKRVVPTIAKAMR